MPEAPIGRFEPGVEELLGRPQRGAMGWFGQRIDGLLDAFDRKLKYWVLAPAVVVLVLLTVYPVASLVCMAFSQIDFAQGQTIWRFTGLDNLSRFRNDWYFRTALLNTTVFVVATVSVEMLLGFFSALVTSRLTHGTSVYRTVMVLPILVPAVAIGCMWRLLYNYEFGPFNQIIVGLGGQAVPWLGSQHYAMLSIILVDVWHWVPFVFLICLAGFEALPVETLEAASVEGANQWQMLRYVVLALMWPTVSVALMFRTIGAINVFDEIFLLTTGGPGTATEVVSLYVYRVFFRENRMGYGALVALVTILIVLCIMWAYRRIDSEGRGS